METTPFATADLPRTLAGRAEASVPARLGNPSLEDMQGSRSVEAWFLGPKAENADTFERLIVEAIRDHVFWRRNYHPEDPSHITAEIKRSPEYVRAMGTLEDNFRVLLAALKRSVPFFSMRYQGHMNWDLTMPAMLGYFAAMLYNQNNVAFEGSTATTLLELSVGDDLCRMLGYELPRPSSGSQAIRPWGHVTCDGTVANIEALWAARNLKCFPHAVRAAMLGDTPLARARALEVPLPTGARSRLVELDAWALFNLHGDVVLDLPRRLQEEHGLTRDAIASAVGAYSVQSRGLHGFLGDVVGSGVGVPLFTVPGTKHYSFPKAAALLGLGAANMVDVAVDEDARMSIADLKDKLESALRERRPVLAVVAVFGSTEESAIDPLAEVLELRDDFQKRGLDFLVHADCAWGGYHVSTMRDDYPLPGSAALLAAAPPPAAPLSRYVRAQFENLGRTDSITVDPHKSGYVPYPAGALCYRNGAMRDLVTFSAPVVFHGEAEPTVGIYGIEGSKPGAAAAAVYLSHSVIRPTKSGYGKVIGQALFSCKKLYARLATMARPDDRFLVVPLPRLPAERRGADASAERRFLAERIDARGHEEISADHEALSFLAEIGPDQNILAYAFNARGPDGRPRRSLELANRINKAIYARLSIDPGHDIYGYDMLVSTTDLDRRNYGAAFFESLLRRLGVEADDDKITVLRSVVMDPWLTETPRGSFIDVLEAELRKAVSAALDEVLPGQRGR